MSEKENKTYYEDPFEFLKSGRRGSKQKPQEQSTQQTISNKNNKIKKDIQELFDGDYSDELL